MNVLVTGSRGMIGSRVAKVLSASHTVVDFDCVQRYEMWENEVDDLFISLESTPDLIIHAGAVFGEGIDENGLWEMNYLATKMLCELALEFGSRFLFFSSAAAINPSEAFGVGNYGWTKRIGEDILKATLPRKDLCIIRPFNVWSLSEEGKRAPSIVWKIVAQQLKSVFKDCTRDFIHVSDVVNAVSSAVKNWQPGTFEVGSGQGVVVEDLVDRIYAHLDDTFERVPVVKNEYSGSCMAAQPSRFLPGWNPVSRAILDRSAELARFMGKYDPLKHQKEAWRNIWIR